MSATCANVCSSVSPDIDPFLVAIVVQHELQHAETIAQTLALAGLLGTYALPTVVAHGDVVVPGGSFTIGSTDAWAYDNERPPHDVELPRFRIDRALVTNGEYGAFIDSGGYGDHDLWSDEGWAWREAEDAEALVYWHGEQSAREPVQHISFHEADAYARWAGKRLPTEAEWEKAAKTAAHELEHITGAVWQWTSSALGGYPGFRAGPVQRVFGALLRRRVPRPARRLVDDGPARRATDVPQLGFAGAAADLLRREVRERWLTPRSRPACERRRGVRSSASRRSCRPSGSTTSAVRGCTRRSRACPSTTCRGANARSCACTRRDRGETQARTLVELGAGNASRTRLLLDALADDARALRAAGRERGRSCGRLPHALAAEYPA